MLPELCNPWRDAGWVFFIETAMYTNSSHYSHFGPSPADQGIPAAALPAGASCAYPMHVPVKMPSMKAKAPAYRGLPDQPDRAGMRNRRQFTEMRVSQLQQMVGAEPAPSPNHPTPETPWWYACLRFADAIANAIGEGVGALREFSKLLPLYQGNEQTLSDIFLFHFEKDFEIWATASAVRGRDLRGVTIVLGEIHNDDEILRLIGLAIHRIISGQKEVRTFIEGNIESSCAGRLNSFSLNLGHCEALEEGSKYFEKLVKLRAETLEKAMACASLVCEDLGMDLKALEKTFGFPSEYAAFVNKHFDLLSLYARLKLNPLIAEYNKADERFQTAANRFMRKRDESMVASLRRSRTTEGPNIVMVGAAHVKGMREMLGDLPCIFMVPRAVVARMQEESAREERKGRGGDEL